MWHTIKQGKPWMGLLNNRSKNGDFYWVSTYVTAIFENGRMSGYESVCSVLSRDRVRGAAAVYARMRAGKPIVSLSARLFRPLKHGWPFLMAGAVSLSGDLWLPKAAAQGVLVASLMLAWYLLESRHRRTIERTLAEHPKAFFTSTGNLSRLAGEGGASGTALLTELPSSPASLLLQWYAYLPRPGRLFGGSVAAIRGGQQSARGVRW